MDELLKNMVDNLAAWALSKFEEPFEVTVDRGPISTPYPSSGVPITFVDEGHTFKMKLDGKVLASVVILDRRTIYAVDYLLTEIKVIFASQLAAHNIIVKTQTL